MTDTATILVVDDVDAGRFVKVQTLRRAGFTVHEATTGAEALDQAARHSPALVLLDINLPDINGLEIGRRLRAMSAPALSPQVLHISQTAVTAADQARGLDYGADGYLTEPVDPTVLVATVRALLRARRAEVALAAALESEREHRKLVEEANYLKDEFLARLSHELRTPLNALMGWIWQLRHSTLGDDARERALDSLERNARVQAQLINDLLDVSRVSKGKLQLEMRMVDLETVVRAVFESVREQAERKSLNLRIDTVPVWVAGDQGRLQQVVTNLLTNAIQFTQSAGRVSLALSTDRDEAMLTVEDNGTGIDAAFLPHVFDPFRQGEGKLSRTHGGLGLGLAVVKQLVDLHGGSIVVASAGRDKGACFTVRLPFEIAHPQAGAAGEVPPLLHGLRLLVVAGDEAERNSLKAVLESSGAQVRVSAAGADPPAGAETDVDLIVSRAPDGRWGLDRPSTPGEQAQMIPPSAGPAEIVRSIARLGLRQPARASDQMA